jgi:hypothetical protein
VSGDPIVAVFSTPSTGTALKTDSHIKYFDPDANAIWDPGESVVYDANGNGVYDAGETVIYGPTPATGTVLATDPHIKFVDSNGDNVWERGEPVVYDSNNNNIYDSGETVIAGPLPALGSAVRVVAHIFYKIYNGVSWSADQRLTSQPTGDHSPSLTQTEDGRVWVAWSGDRTLPMEVLYKTTTDGNVWTPEVSLYTGSTGETNPAIIQDRNGTIWFVWGHNLPCSSCGPGVTFQVDLYSSNSMDNGATWTPPADLTQNCTNCSTTDEVYPSLVQLSDKKLYIFFTIINSSAATVNLYYMSNLISPIHDAKMNIATGSTVNLRASQTYTLRANVTNNGDYNDTLTITLTANSTSVASNSTVVLKGQTVQIVVNWVVRVKPGKYIMTAVVSAPGESLTNQVDNTATIPGILLVRPVGDVNGDCVVNIIDLVIVAGAFGTSVGSPGYNPIADVNGDGTVNIADLSLVGGSFAQTC